MKFQTTIPLDWGEKKQDDFSVSRQHSDIFEKGALATHWHDCFEILYVTEGYRNFSAGQQIFPMEIGDILVIPPRLPHGATGGIYRNIVLGYAESVIYTPDSPFSGMRFLLPFRGAEAQLIRGDSENIKRLRTLIAQTADLFDGSSPVRMLEVHACILQIHGILWQIYQGVTRDTERAFRYLSEAQEYIETHLAEDISPYDIARSLHISHSHLCRLVKSALGISPAALINQYRLCLAERLMTEHRDWSVTEIALRAGFSDSSYFIRCFKAERGITPRQFQLAADGK